MTNNHRNRFAFGYQYHDVVHHALVGPACFVFATTVEQYITGLFFVFSSNGGV
jgi:hypothetical protein